MHAHNGILWFLLELDPELWLGTCYSSPTAWLETLARAPTYYPREAKGFLHCCRVPPASGQLSQFPNPLYVQLTLSCLAGRIVLNSNGVHLMCSLERVSSVSSYAATLDSLLKPVTLLQNFSESLLY